MKWFKNCYGFDNFSIFLIVISTPLLFTRRSFLIGIAIIIYALWRSFSKDISSRRREEQVFANWLYGLKSGLYKWNYNVKNYFKNLKNKTKYVVVSCPHCSQQLRLPKRKGKIIVTCKKCQYEFKFRT